MKDQKKTHIQNKIQIHQKKIKNTKKEIPKKSKTTPKNKTTDNIVQKYTKESKINMKIKNLRTIKKTEI